MGYVVKLTIPGNSIPVVRERIERLRRVFLAAAEGEADMFAVLAWELAEKHTELRTRRLKRRA